MAVAAAWWIHGSSGSHGGPLESAGSPLLHFDTDAGNSNAAAQITPSPLERESVGRRNVVVVLEENGDPIQGAQIRSVDEPEPLGITDSSGELDWGSLGLPIEVEVSAQDFCSQRIHLPVDFGRATVRMRSKVIYRGRALGPLGEPVPHARVLVRPAASILRMGQILGQGGDDWHRTTANEAGEFEIRGLNPGLDYTVAAGAPGWMLPQAVAFKAGAPSQEPASTLVLAYAFCTLLRLVDSGGGPPIASPELYGFGPELSIPSNEVSSLYDQASAVLAGVPASDTDHHSRDARLVLFSSSANHAALIARFQVRVPGYDLREDSIVIPRQESPIHEQEVVLSLSAGACFGGLRIQVVSNATESDGEGIGRGAALLGSLKARPFSGTAISFRVDPNERGEVLLDLVPCGTYTLTLSTSHGRMEALTQAVEVHPAAGAEAHFDLSGLATLHVRLIEQDGGEYRGLVHLRLSDTGSRYGTHVTLREAPYVLRHLQPGAFDLRVQLPFEPVPRPRPVTIALDPGQAASILWPLDEEAAPSPPEPPTLGREPR